MREAEIGVGSFSPPQRGNWCRFVFLPGKTNWNTINFCNYTINLRGLNELPFVSARPVSPRLQTGHPLSRDDRIKVQRLGAVWRSWTCGRGTEKRPPRAPRRGKGNRPLRPQFNPPSCQGGVP